MTLGSEDRSSDDGIHTDANCSTDLSSQEPRRRRPIDAERQAAHWLESWVTGEQEGRQPLLVPSVPAG